MSFPNEIALETAAYENDFKIHFSGEQFASVSFHPKEAEGKFVGSTGVSTFPGNNEVAILHNSFILAQYRKQGFGMQKHIGMLKVLKAAGCTTVLCTVNHTNDAELNILRANHWVEIGPVSATATMWRKGL